MEINIYTDAIQEIKSAILKSRYRAAALANRELLSLYYGIGKYISENSRKGFWGTRAIETISERLQQELPGLRGFSASNMKNMRMFYEEWECVFTNRPLVADEIRQPLAGEIRMKPHEIDIEALMPIRQPPAGELEFPISRDNEFRTLTTHEINRLLVFFFNLHYS